MSDAPELRLPAAPSSDRTTEALVVAGFALVAAAQVSNMLTARGLGGDVPPFTLAFLRWSVVACCLMPFAVAAWRRDQMRISRHNAAALVAAGFFGFFMCGAPVYIAGATTTAINIALIMTLSPLAVLLLSWLIGLEKIGRNQVAGMLIALAGALIIIARGDPAFFLHLEAAPGDVIIFASMIAWSIYTLLQSRVAAGAPPVARVGMFAAVGALLTLPAAAYEAVTQPVAAFDWRLPAAALFTGLVPGVFAYSAFAFMAGRFGSVRASIVLYLGPIMAAVLSFLILREPPGWIHLVGGILILGGVSTSLRR